MYVSIQTVCACHGLLTFESIHCDRCRSLIPFQITDESLCDPMTSMNSFNGVDLKTMASKQPSNMLVPYQKPHQHHHHRHHQQEPEATTGRVRFRVFCPFCNSPTYVLRYYCKRERMYYHLRIQSFGENEYSIYKSIADVQNMGTYDEKNKTPRTSERTSTSAVETNEDSYSLTGSMTQTMPSTIIFNQNRITNARDTQIENEKKLYQLNDLEGDLFNVLRSGLFYDTMVQCQDNVKIQVHRSILGGRSPWFRNLLNQYHDTNGQEDYVLQISIDDVQSEVMNEILNYMYTNRCLISLKNAPDLLVAAKRFELEKLTKQIAEFLLSRLNVDNAIDMLISAHESNSEALKYACIRLINRNIEKIKRTEKWKTFKTQYVDLVPELYESKMERVEAAPVTFLPDVFTAPVVPSDSLLTLSKLYENPVKQRAPSPVTQILPPHQQVPQPQVHAPTYKKSDPAKSNPPISQGTSGTFNNRNEPVLNAEDQRKSPVRRRASSNTQNQPVPPPVAPPLTRNVFPTVKQNTEVDAYRRPVNVYQKSVALPATQQKRTSIPMKASYPPPVKVSRAVSPRRVIEIRRSPTSTEDMQPEEHIKLGRVVSVETMD